MDPSSWVTHYAQSRLRGAATGPGPGGGPGTTSMSQNHCHQNQMSTYPTNPMQSWLLSHSHHHPTVNQANNPGDPGAFSSNPFGIHPPHPPPHPGVPSYDASGFLSNPFQSAKASYLPTPSGFYKAMTAKDDFTSLHSANDMSNLRAAGFPPPPSYCSSMQGALHASAMGHPDTAGAAATGVSLFSHHFPPSSLRHHPNLMPTHNHPSSAAGPFGILPHEAVNVMNTGTGHQTGPSLSSHSNSSSSHSNKSCSLETNKHHHHKNNNLGSSFEGMMSTMSQNVHSNTSRNSSRTYDHQLSKQFAHHHHHPHQTDSYFSNFLMSQENYAASQYAAATAAANMRVASNQHMLGISSPAMMNSRNTVNSIQYSSMNFSNSLARDLMSVGSNSQSSKINSNSTCSNQVRSNINSAITDSNHLSNCNMMMPGLSVNNYSANPVSTNSNMLVNTQSNVTVNNHGSNSRSSSVASNHAIQQGSESSSCSYGYNSPSANLPHSPYPQRSSVSVTPVLGSSQTPNAASNANVGNGVQDFNASYQNQPNTYSTMATSASTNSTYPTPPSSVNQQINSQPSNGPPPAQDDGLNHFSSASQKTNNGYSNSFTSSPYSTSKLPANAGASSANTSVVNNMSSCMVAAAAAASSNTNNGRNIGYLHNNLTSGTAALTNTDHDSCLSNIGNVAPISVAMSETNKLTDPQLNSSRAVDVNVIGNETALNSVFTTSEMEFASLNFPPVDEAATNYAQSMRIDSHATTTFAAKKKKEKVKKPRKKNQKAKKPLDRIAMTSNNLPYSFSYSTGAGYQEPYSTNLNQNCNSYLMHHHSQQQPQQPPQPPQHPQPQQPQQQQQQQQPPPHPQPQIQPQRPPTPQSEPPSTMSTSKSQPQTRTHSQSQVHSKSHHHHHHKHQSESQLQSQPQTGPTIHESPQHHHQDQFDAQFQSHQQQSQSLNQSQQSLQPQSHTTTLPPPPQQLQTQPNLMSSNNVVQRTTQCYDTNSINLESDLINNSLANQIQTTSPQNQNSAQMSIDFVKSHTDQSSQSLLTHHSNANNSHLSSEADNRLVADKLAALQEDLNFLTETANDCERSQVHEMANQNMSKCHPITVDSSANLTSNESNNCSSTAVTSLCDSNNSTTFDNKTVLSLDMKLASAKRSKSFRNDILLDNDKVISETFSKSNDLINCENSLINSNNTLKKKKKHKESKTKLNGQKASKLSKKNETVINPLIDMVTVDSEKTSKNLDRSLSNSKLYNTSNSTKKSNEFEAKFFKMRPGPNSNNTNSTTTTSTKSDKVNDKKRKIKETVSNVAHDEYEFPDSPETFRAKKSKKSYSENSKKKGSEKLTVSNTNPLGKKSNSSSKAKISPLGNGSHSKLKEKNDNKQSRTTNQMINCSKAKPAEDKISKAQTTFSNNHCQQPNKISKEKVKQQSLNVSSQSENLENSFKRHSTSQTLNQGKTDLSTATATTTAATTTIAATNINATLSLTSSSVTITMTPASTVQTFVPVAVTSRAAPFKSTPSSTSVSTLKSTIATTTSSSSSSSSLSTTTTTSSSLTTTSTTTISSSLTTTSTTAVSTATTIATTQSNKSNTSVSMQSAGTNTPRRRSQDKKASTIREGLMRTSDFVISLDEINCELPMIWRIEGKSLLQRFEPTEQNGNIVYINTSSYSAWNPTVRQRYTGVDVRIMGYSRTRIVVEKLGLTKPSSNNKNGEAPIERCKTVSSNTSSSSFQHQADFEVFIQTLISQALDSNFISEIVKENDEYFLSHLQAIDDYCVRRKSRFFSKVKWDANIVKCVETFSNFTIIPQTQVGDLRCRLCHDNWSTQILHFTGDSYDAVTLETKEPVDIKQTKYAACDQCKERITLFSHLTHQKYNFFTKCRDKVEKMRDGVEDKDSPMILEECLKDTDWMQSLFKQFEEIWQSCDRSR